jgi:hypothetical protein
LEWWSSIHGEPIYHLVLFSIVGRLATQGGKSSKPVLIRSVQVDGRNTQQKKNQMPLELLKRWPPFVFPVVGAPNSELF